MNRSNDVQNEYILTLPSQLFSRKILLPDRTNIYSTISFLNDNAGSSSAHVFGRKLFINDALSLQCG